MLILYNLVEFYKSHLPSTSFLALSLSSLLPCICGFPDEKNPLAEKKKIHLTESPVLPPNLLLQRAFVAERNELLEIQKKKWEEKMAFRREKEEENLLARARRVDDFEQQLQHLRVQDAEEYNMVKIRLETDVQVECV